MADINEIYADLKATKRGKRCFEGAKVEFKEHIEYKRSTDGNTVPVDMEIVEVQYPGRPPQAHTVTQQHIDDYPELYQLFKAGKCQPEEGTPITHWPLARPAEIKELRAKGFNSVEQVAKATGEAKKALGGMQHLIADAKEWIEAQNSDQTTVTKLKKENTSLKRKVEKLTNQFEQAVMRIQALEGGGAASDLN